MIIVCFRNCLGDIESVINSIDSIKVSERLELFVSWVFEPNDSFQLGKGVDALDAQLKDGLLFLK
jgi:hypothetical protein